MWSLWQQGPPLRELTGIEPRLASWEKNDHPSQVRLREYLRDLCSKLGPLPEQGKLFLDLTVDIGESARLLHDRDLENYLTPLFGTEYLPASRFSLVSARKMVGGGSSLRIGLAEPPIPAAFTGWQHLTVDAGAGSQTKEWKERIRTSLITSRVEILPDGPVEVHLAWRCSSSRNWVRLWKPTGDGMGPLLGYVDDSKPFHPYDDRIVELGLHLVPDDGVGHDVKVGMWWRHANQLNAPTPPCEQSIPRQPQEAPMEIEMPDTSASEFVNDEQGYLAWIANHPSGYVVNTPASKTPDYMVLHRASCTSVASYTEMAKPGGFTDRQYIKVCADTIDELRAWVKQHGRTDGSFSNECSRCKP